MGNEDLDALLDKYKEDEDEVKAKESKVQTTFLRTPTHLYEQVFKDDFASFVSYRISDGFITEGVKSVEYN